jgi:DNA-3-methyladenine glycosylase
MPDPNPYYWLTADSLSVAPALLGTELVSTAGGKLTAGRIVEVEAYHGLTDPASHAYRGRTLRTAPMFEEGGTIYVYFTYGMYNCVNIVTGPAGSGQAVLIRALEPTDGLEVMAERRKVTDPKLLASGPGRLTIALGINRELSGSRLGKTLSLRPPRKPVLKTKIAAGPRIGLSRAQDFPWRFYIKDSRFISKTGWPRPAAAGRGQEP